MDTKNETMEAVLKEAVDLVLKLRNPFLVLLMLSMFMGFYYWVLCD